MGMVGIDSMFLGAHVTITDLPHVLPNLLLNETTNEVTSFKCMDMQGIQPPKWIIFK
jgi:hypothetical protein